MTFFEIFKNLQIDTCPRVSFFVVFFNYVHVLGSLFWKIVVFSFKIRPKIAISIVVVGSRGRPKIVKNDLFANPAAPRKSSFTYLSSAGAVSAVPLPVVKKTIENRHNRTCHRLLPTAWAKKSILFQRIFNENRYFFKGFSMENDTFRVPSRSRSGPGVQNR